MWWAFMMGFLFVSLFNLIGWVAQKIGVAVASVANKMSLVVPFLFSLYLYNEKATALNVAGIIIALTAVLLTCWPARKEERPSAKRLSPAFIFLMPAILFAGSGLLDTMIKYVEQSFLNDDNKNDYLITAFASAASIGTLLLTCLFLTKKQRFDPRAILAGIAIGLPNYFSIWCLVKVLKAYQGKSAAVIPINNMGIVLFSSLMAYTLFKEHLSWINWTGIVLALGAIALIAC
jgi:drug/metabolite transporter (DMT)-like permease